MAIKKKFWKKVKLMTYVMTTLELIAGGVIIAKWPEHSETVLPVMGGLLISAIAFITGHTKTDVEAIRKGIIDNLDKD